MPSHSASEALRKRLLSRVGAAGVLLVIGLAVLGWLERRPPSASSLAETQPTAPHAAAPTIAPKPLDAGTASSGPVPASSDPLAQTPQDAAKSAPPAEPASALVATGAVAAGADSAVTPAEDSGPSKKPPAPAKEKLPRGPHLQAGVFAQAVNAEELKARLEAEGLPVYIESRVQIGPFKNRKEAEKMREKLKADGVTTVLIAQ